MHLRKCDAKEAQPSFSFKATRLTAVIKLFAPKRPCAMVPLKPNELRRDSPPPLVARGGTSTGIRNGLDDTTDDKWAFNLRDRRSRENREKRAAEDARTEPAQLRVDRDDEHRQGRRHQ